MAALDGSVTEKFGGLDLWGKRGVARPKSEAGDVRRIYPGPKVQLDGACAERRDCCLAYFHSHILETVSPEASTSYSKGPHALLRRASFFEAVRKKSIPR